MLSFLAEHWTVIAAVVAVLISVLNAVTKHFSEHKGLVKWLTFVTEVLSFLTSQHVKGALKLPLTSKSPSEMNKKVRGVK